MSDCKDCFNGCLERIPDNCVKYTGQNIPILDIENGNTLAYVETQIFNFILSFITGKGIKIDLSDLQLCTIISSNLPISGDITLEHITKALIKSVCAIDTRVTNIITQLTILESDYDIKCLTGVTNISDTHLTLQATINKVCQLQADFSQLLNNLSANYITSSNINQYITNYNNTVGLRNQVASKMIPFVAMPYFPTTQAFNGNFDATGSGQGLWTKVYLCNGKNGTPDLRGRSLVGATTGMNGDLITNPDILPSLGNYPNPNYGLKDIFGKNAVVLNDTQIPSHIHPNTISVIDQGHSHITYADMKYNSPGANLELNPGVAVSAGSTTTSTNAANILATITNAQNQNGNQSHTNIQPSIGCYYIMHIP